MLNFISFSYLNNLTLERGGIGDKVQQNHYEKAAVVQHRRKRHVCEQAVRLGAVCVGELDHDRAVLFACGRQDGTEQSLARAVVR